jgi:nucleoid DNA-binding protein
LTANVIGVIGELHPQWVQKYELPLRRLFSNLISTHSSDAELPQYAEVSRFPPVVRDLAIVVDQKLELAAPSGWSFSQPPALVQDIRLFDVYTGKGHRVREKSLAFRIVMQDTQRTLQDAEVDAAMQQLMAYLQQRLRGTTSRLTGKDMTLTKAELADLLFEKVGLNKREAKDMVEAFFEEIRNALERGDGVKALRLRQFPAARQAAAPGTQPENWRRNPDHRSARRHLPRQPES